MPTEVSECRLNFSLSNLKLATIAALSRHRMAADFDFIFVFLLQFQLFEMVLLTFR